MDSICIVTVRKGCAVFMQRYENLVLDEERALYAVRDAEIIRCKFEGPADGESALKECRDVVVRDSGFRLR